MPDKKLYKVVHSSPEIDTVWKYINAQDSAAYNYRDSISKFLAVKGEDGLTNRQRIESTFKSPEEKKNIGLEGKNLPLKVGTVLYLEFEEVNQVSFLIEGIEVVSTDDVAFKAAKLAEIEADKGYVSAVKKLPTEFQAGSTKDIMPDVTVWIWCRSLSVLTEGDEELQGEFFDLTPYVQKVSTNLGKNGGNFQITLPPLVCELGADQKWQLKRGTIEKYGDNTNQVSHYVAEGSLYDFNQDGTGLSRNQFLFDKIINSNDLIFIRFETLNLEVNQRYTDKNHNYIDKSLIPNRIYDMIGLVDSSLQTTNAAANDVQINITGRDLSKLFIDDGTYFFALENSQGIVRVAGSTTLKNSLLSRIVEEKGMQLIGLANFTSIEYILKFIIQQLSNIRIVPNDLFSAYGDKRNNRFNEIGYNNKLTERKSNYTPKFKEEVTNGIWQIVKLVIDKSVSQRRLADTSFSTAQGSLLNFIHSAIQEPLTEFYMDTYGDQYHLIVRKPPYDQVSLVSLLQGRVNTEDGEATSQPAIIDVDDEDVITETLMQDDTQVYSWYHFFPKGAMINSSVDYSTSIMPAIFFDEFAQIYGSKPLQQSHNYVPYVPMSFDSQFGNLLYEQGFKDLKYVIESNQYIPFTRKGTLVLNGDRRIKIGNVIRYKPTGEIFFVNSVQQNFQITDNSIERTTVVQVSRGMIEQFIYGVHLTPEGDNTNKRVFVSYFNIIDTRLNIKYKEIKVPVYKKRLIGKKVIKSANDNPDSGLSRFSDLIDHTPFQDVAEDKITKPEMVTGVKFLESYNSYPENKKRFIKLINAINNSGYKVVLFDADTTNRTYARQAALHQQDSRNARAGHSTHEFGEGIDITIVHAQNGSICTKRTTEESWRATGVPLIANKLGFTWGGNNDGTFGTKDSGGYYIDRVHFQLNGSGGNDGDFTENVYEDYTEYTTTRGIDENIVFQNFKVNKYTFNFFLKNLQFKEEYRQVKNRQVYNSDQEGTRVDGKSFNDESLDEVVIKATRKKKH